MGGYKNFPCRYVYAIKYRIEFLLLNFSRLTKLRCLDSVSNMNALVFIYAILKFGLNIAIHRNWFEKMKVDVFAVSPVYVCGWIREYKMQYHKLILFLIRFCV